MICSGLRLPVHHQFLNRKQCQSAPFSVFHIFLTFEILYYLARRQPVEPWSSSSSVKYLEGDAWLRALEQQLRLFKCTGLSIAHRLPVGIDVYIHFRLFSPLNRRNTFWKNIQSLKHASFYLYFLLWDFIFVFFLYRTQISKTGEGGGTKGLNIIQALHAFFFVWLNGENENSNARIIWKCCAVVLVKGQAWISGLLWVLSCFLPFSLATR